MEMPFGKHKGEDIVDVPTAYLVWMEDKPDLEPWLASEVKAELSRRREPTTGKSVKLPRDVLAGKMYELLRQAPDDLFGQPLTLGEFRAKFERKSN